MKKLMLTLLAAGTVATAAHAQPGSILVYGNAGISLAKDSAENSSANITFSPGVGYQFNNNWTVGLELGVRTQSSKPDNGERYTRNNFNVGPFVRYTCPLNNIFSVFGQAGTGFRFGSDRFDGETVEGSKHAGFYLNFFPAVGVNVHKGFALNFGFGGLGFSTDKYEDADNTASNFDISFGQQVNIGISKNFGGHHARRHHHEPGDDMRRIDTKDDEDDMPRKKKARSNDDE